MKDYTLIRHRYLRDDLSVRLGGLAANLRRITSASSHSANGDAVAGLLDESKHFIEWTAAEAEVDMAAELVELQIQLARWQRNWQRIWTNPQQRQQIAEEAGRWSNRVLELSGLLD